MGASRNWIRGQAFRSVAEALDQVVAPGAKGRALSTLPTEVADAFRFGSLISSGWYPIDWYNELHRAARSVAQGGGPLHRRIGRASITHDMNTVHRFLLKLASPALAIEQAQRILGLFIKDCTTRLEQDSTEMARLHLRVPGASLELWEDVAGATEVVLETTGVARVQVNVDPSANLDSALLSAKWQAQG